ncbi:vomeronasal type-1 receptor 1-like [Phoca vitulina]|uniref:vomeronasal type-1 receptor 1-like n=1 Tax=Phoca vitulina TaxID=9720 RepID=UPI0013965A25|nr:vomeronasal type-1 receptor 1-like [Phoca vitulina]
MSEFGKCVCVWSVLLELRRKVLGRSHHSGSNESLQVPKRDRIVRTGTGFVDNLLPFIIYLYILFIQPHQKKPVDGILIHLALASVITAVFRGIPYIVTSFGIRNILEDIGCKAVLYIFRVTWGAYICTSSLLSTSQAIIISPAHSKWAWLKPRIFTLILPLLIYSWISSCHVYAGFLLFFFMIWTSFHMVIVLFRHHKTPTHIHSPSLSPQSFPETKATHTILLLVSCFVFFYGTTLGLSIHRAEEERAQHNGVEPFRAESEEPERTLNHHQREESC